MQNNLIIKINSCSTDKMRIILFNAFIRHGLDIVSVTLEEQEEDLKSFFNEKSQLNQIINKINKK